MGNALQLRNGYLIKNMWYNIEKLLDADKPASFRPWF